MCQKIICVCLLLAFTLTLFCGCEQKQLVNDESEASAQEQQTEPPVTPEGESEEPQQSEDETPSTTQEGEENENKEDDIEQLLPDDLGSEDLSFLTEDQITLYTDARDLFAMLDANIDGFDMATPDEDNPEKTRHYIRRTNGKNTVGYMSFIGRYRDWEKFEELCLTFFTEEFYKQQILGVEEDFPALICVDGRVYCIDAALGSAFYHPDRKPDTYRLLERTENEISFLRTCYYFVNGLPEAKLYKYETTTVRMEKTKDGFRIAQITDGGNPSLKGCVVIGK